MKRLTIAAAIAATVLITGCAGSPDGTVGSGGVVVDTPAADTGDTGFTALIGTTHYGSNGYAPPSSGDERNTGRVGGGSTLPSGTLMGGVVIEGQTGTAGSVPAGEPGDTGRTGTVGGGS